MKFATAVALAPILAACATAFLLTGCSTPPATAPVAPRPVYYPSAPAVARYQYLTSFSSDKDLRDKAGKTGGFAAFIGAQEDLGVTEIIKPYGIALHDSALYICDTIAFAIDIVDLKSGAIRRFQPKGDGRLGKPINIAVDADGTRYVADTSWGMVLIYGADDSYLGAIGTKGVTKPTDVAVHGDRLYIADLLESCVKVLDRKSHKELFRIPREGDGPESKLFSPANIAVGDEGKVYVSDIGGFAVKVFDPEGRFLMRVGELGTQIGGMVRPKGIAVDRAGRFYVVDAATEVVQVFDPEGKLLLFFGEPAGSEVGLVLPAKVMVDYDHVSLFSKYAAPDFDIEYLVFVTNQYGPRKVSVYGFGSRRGQSANTDGGRAVPQAAQPAGPAK